MALRDDNQLTLAALQRIVDGWICTVGKGYFSPLTNMAVLTEEVGEVARIMARDYGEQSWRNGASRPELADELADVVWVVAAIANQTGVDLTEAMGRNIDKKTRRDCRRHLDNPKIAPCDSGQLENKKEQ